jgi:hypothetical protein
MQLLCSMVNAGCYYLKETSYQNLLGSDAESGRSGAVEELGEVQNSLALRRKLEKHELPKTMKHTLRRDDAVILDMLSRKQFVVVTDIFRCGPV